jgi:hypothetical protein
MYGNETDGRAWPIIQVMDRVPESKPIWKSFSGEQPRAFAGAANMFAEGFPA